MPEENLYAIVAFEVPKHKSLLYRRFLTTQQLLVAVGLAINKGANVISIRKVDKNERKTT